MNDAKRASDDNVLPDGLARRLFVITMLGIVLCMGAILALMSTA